ncbi:hypothetical protein ACJX0J_009381 [Zea mays]
MRRSELVVQEGEKIIPEKDDAITEAASDDDEDDGILSPSKPSHIEFGKSTSGLAVQANPTSEQSFENELSMPKQRKFVKKEFNEFDEADIGEEKINKMHN